MKWERRGWKALSWASQHTYFHRIRSVKVGSQTSDGSYWCLSLSSRRKGPWELSVPTFSPSPSSHYRSLVLLQGRIVQFLSLSGQGLEELARISSRIELLKTKKIVRIPFLFLANKWFTTTTADWFRDFSSIWELPRNDSIKIPDDSHQNCANSVWQFKSACDLCMNRLIVRGNMRSKEKEV